MFRISFVYLSYILRISFVYVSVMFRLCFVYHWFFVWLVERIFDSPPLGTRRGEDLLSAGSLWSPAVKHSWTSSTSLCSRVLQKVTQRLSIVGRIRRPSTLAYRNMFRNDYCLGSWWFTNFCVFWNGGF